MRQTAATLNRVWLGIIGIVLLLLGLMGLMIATGLGGRLLPDLGTIMPSRSGQIVGAPVTTYLSRPGGAAVLALIGLVVLVLGLAWIGAQVPRKPAGKPFRLHDEPAGGLTTCDPDVIADAVQREVEDLPDVAKASALLRGTASLPELHLRVTASDQADLVALLERLEHEVVTHVATALDTPIERLTVALEVDRARRSRDAVTVDARPDRALAQGGRQLL